MRWLSHQGNKGTVQDQLLPMFVLSLKTSSNLLYIYQAVFIIYADMLEAECHFYPTHRNAQPSNA